MKFIKANLKEYISTERFKLIIGIMFIMSLYMVGQITREYSYINSILYIFNDTIYLTITFALILVNSITTIKLFDKDNEYIIRCKTKKMYLKKLTKKIFMNNTIIFILQILMNILLLIILNRNGIIIDKIGGYSITNLTFTIFYLIRTFILIQCISLIGAFVYKSGPKIILWILVVCLLIAFANAPYRYEYVVEGLQTIFLNPADYLHVQQYKDFGFELEVSFFYVLAWFIITYIVYLITAKRIKQIGD